MGVESAILVLFGGTVLLFLLRLRLTTARKTGSPAVVTVEESNSDAVVCPICGSENDVSYSFCSQCASKLSLTAYTSPPVWGYYYF